MVKESGTIIGEDKSPKIPAEFGVNAFPSHWKRQRPAGYFTVTLRNIHSRKPCGKKA